MPDQIAPRITILTIVRNAPDALRKTLESVSIQNEKPDEHLIVDGASTDDFTIKIAKEYCEKFSYAKLITEPDSGISDALNKGARNAKGERIICLNAGDCLFSLDSVRQLKNEATNLPIKSVLYGQAELIYPGYASLKTTIHHRKLGSIFEFWNPICHQSTLVSKSLMMENPFRNDLRFSMDLELWLSLLDQKVPFVRSKTVFCKYETGGISSDPRNYNSIIREHLRVYFAKGRYYKIIPACLAFLRHMIESSLGGISQPILRMWRKKRSQ